MTRLQALLLRAAVAARFGSVPLEDYIDLDKATDALVGHSDEKLLQELDRSWTQICEEASEVRVFAGAA